MFYLIFEERLQKWRQLYLLRQKKEKLLIQGYKQHSRMLFLFKNSLQKGVERFFQFGLYITLFSESLQDLEETSKKLTSTLSSILLITKTTTLQMEDGFKSTTPIGVDKLYIARNMDTTSLASTFPFTSATLTQDKGESCMELMNRMDL